MSETTQPKSEAEIQAARKKKMAALLSGTKVARQKSTRQTCKFENPGDSHTGIVESYDWIQRKDSNGNVVTYLTPEGTTEEYLVTVLHLDGNRTVFINMWGRSFAAFAAARNEVAEKIGDPDYQLEPGDKIKVTMTGYGEPPKEGYHAPKLWEMKIAPSAAKRKGAKSEAKSAPAPAEDDRLAALSVDERNLYKTLIKMGKGADEAYEQTIAMFKDHEAKSGN